MYIRNFNDRDVSSDDFCQDLHTRWVRLQVQKVSHKTMDACREKHFDYFGVLLVLMKTKYQVMHNLDKLTQEI